MSLLDRGNAVVTVFKEVTTNDEDGNPIVRPGTTGLVCKATIQPLGTVSEDADASGQVPSGPTRYRLRLSRADEARVGTIGRYSEIEWRGERWKLHGDPLVFGGSRRTAHTDYVIGRA